MFEVQLAFIELWDTRAEPHNPWVWPAGNPPGRWHVWTTVGLSLQHHQDMAWPALGCRIRGLNQPLDPESYYILPSALENPLGSGLQASPPPTYQ